MNITITHTASPELLSTVNRYIDHAFGKQIAVNNETATTKPAGKPPKESKPETSNDNAANDFKSGDAITIEQVRVAVKGKSDAGKKDQIKALLAEYNVPNVTALDASFYPEFVTKINNL